MITPDPRFAFYEKVRIQATDPGKSHLNGEIAAVLGRTETEDKSSWYYAVSVYSLDRTWCFFEYELEPTGEFAREEDFFDGTSVRVRVDEQGRGTIVSEDEEEKSD